MKVFIKGAGDLASGIALRLHRCGFAVAMTEIAVPTTVRRSVAFSRAVYEGRAMVEEVEGVLCKNVHEIGQAAAADQVAVVVDPECQAREAWNPEVVVDGVLAKRNLGTRITDAKLVVGAGPGFLAGTDCHCVVETLRGHDLGRCIWKGGARPNTGVPGKVWGYDKERIIRATAQGSFRGIVAIGDMVKQGDVVAFCGREPVYAQIGGVVRGLLQDGVETFPGMKAGDVDPRGIAASCQTVSDKALAVGGGVLEAILYWRKKGGFG